RFSWTEGVRAGVRDQESEGQRISAAPSGGDSMACMGRESTRQLQGVITSVRCRETRRPGLWSHRFRIRGHDYSNLSRDPVSMFQVGDLVRFDWAPNRPRGSRTIYRNIMGTPELLRPREDSERAD